MKEFFNLSKWGTLLLVALSVGLVSCSSDDDEGGAGAGGGGNASGTLTYGDEEGAYGTAKIFRDSQGRITRVVTNAPRLQEEGLETVTYSANKIVYKQSENEDGEGWDNYLVVESELNADNLIAVSTIIQRPNSVNPYKRQVRYEYNSSRQLVRMSNYYQNTSDGSWYKSGEGEIKWENGNIVSVPSGGMTETCTYTSIPDTQGLNGWAYNALFDDGGFCYMHGYFGVKSAHLVSSISSSYYSPTTYTYQMNGEKVVKVSMDAQFENFWYRFN